MRSLHSPVCIALLILTAAVHAADAGIFDNISRIGELMIDPPTLECLGFRWYINGDDDADGTVTVRYREKGSTRWRDALPLLRVNREVANWDYGPYAADNLFAGSIMGLEPDTEYEVRLVMTDPDGGEADTTLTAATRPVPIAPEPSRTLHLWPGTVPAGREGFVTFDELIRTLDFGDLVLVHGGVHRVGPDGIRIPSGGIEDRPIVFRGAGDGEAVIQAEYNTIIFDISDCHHLFFEDLTIRGGDEPFDDGRRRLSVANDTFHLGHAFFADGASWLTVRRCRILNVRMGFYSYSEHSENWYIADNVIEGRNTAWYPRGHDNPSHTGVNIYGRGHVVCHNRISKFWDCIAIANYGKPQPERELQCVAIDFYNNDLSEAVDDGIEADYGCHNIRVYNNRIINAHTGLSAQPTYGGPIYFIRNELYNITSLSLKLHNWCTGLEIYHNTMVCARGAFRSYPRWQNAILRNNLFIGVSGYAVETGSPHPRTTLDYNGYRRAEEERLFKWDDGGGYKRYDSLEAFTEATGFEEHGLMVDYDIFMSAGPPVEGEPYGPDFGDLALRSGAVAVDRGVVLPTVNDGFTGDAPDLGCFERGKPKPHYGPRE